jgi:hypothetical protein
MTMADKASDIESALRLSLGRPTGFRARGLDQPSQLRVE